MTRRWTAVKHVLKRSNLKPSFESFSSIGCNCTSRIRDVAGILIVPVPINAPEARLKISRRIKRSVSNFRLTYTENFSPRLAVPRQEVESQEKCDSASNQ